MSAAKCETGWGDLSTRALFDAERPSPHPARFASDPPPPGEGGRAPHIISHTNPFPLRLILPDDGEGKCAVQHSVLVSQ